MCFGSVHQFSTQQRSEQTVRATSGRPTAWTILRMKSCCSVSGVGRSLRVCERGISPAGFSPHHSSNLSFVSCPPGLVLNPDVESESEDSEPDGPDDLVIPSPEMDDVKGERGQDLVCGGNTWK